jgi:hypothetical protein
MILLSFALLLGCSQVEPQPLEAIEVPLRGASIMGDAQGDPYRYFRYNSVESAQRDLKLLSKDGKKIAGKRMPWNGPVHIYYREKRIVIYVGKDPETRATIERVFPEQFAGDPW